MVWFAWRDLPKSATRIPKQFISLLSCCDKGNVEELVKEGGGPGGGGAVVSCGRLRATAMPIGTVLSEMTQDTQEREREREGEGREEIVMQISIS